MLLFYALWHKPLILVGDGKGVIWLQCGAVNSFENVITRLIRWTYISWDAFDTFNIEEIHTINVKKFLMGIDCVCVPA